VVGARDLSPGLTQTKAVSSSLTVFEGLSSIGSLTRRFEACSIHQSRLNS
jgi:hypothetical protein